MTLLHPLAAELEGIDLGDARLERRAQQIAARAACDPAKSFPKLVQDSSELEGLYRFFQNERVKAVEILRPHQVATAKRCAEHALVRVAHDTCAFRFTGDREGMGPLAGKGTGFYVHFGLVIGDGESRAPLGVVAINDFVRSQRREPISHSARTLKARRTPREEKESAKWMRSVDVAEEALQHRAAIHVMDREADDYTLLSELVGNGRRFVIRGHPERRLERGGEKLQHRLDGASAVFFRSVCLAERAKPKKGHAARGERSATLSVRSASIELCKPQFAQSDVPSIVLNVVQVYEPDPPPGEEPIEWTLLTTEAIDSADAVEAIVDHYRARWRIEEYFRALKSGCSVEKRQLDDRAALVRALAVFAPIAWRLLAMRTLSRIEKPPSAATLFDEDDLLVVRLLASKRKHQMPTDPTVRDVMLALAAIGGHLKQNGDPGWITIGRGHDDFTLARVGFTAGRAHGL
jgi:hypothetical protein